MSETSPEGRGGRISRWRSRTRGTKTMKAGYALAGRDVKNWDKTVLERIGSARMTPASLQQLAQTAVNAEVRGGGFSAQSQARGQVATNRMQATRAQQAPTRNPFRQAARGISRWRNVRHGTKMVKAAMVLGAKQAKNADRGVRQAMGVDGRLSPANMAALVEDRMHEVFRPEVYAQQQQAQQGPGQQGQGQGQQVQGQGQQVPQQGAQAQQAPSLMQQLQQNQQRTVQLMAEMQQLQMQMQQQIQTRMEQINQEAANLAAIQGQMAEMNQQFNQQMGQPQPQAQVQQEDPNARFNVGQHPIVQTGEAAQQPAESDPQQAADNQQPQAEGGEPQLGDGAQPQVAEGAQQQVEGGELQGEGGEPQLGDGAQQPQVAASGAQQVAQEGGQQLVEGGDQQGAPAAQQQTQGDVWVDIAQQKPQQGAGSQSGVEGETDQQRVAKEQAARAAAAAGDVAPVRKSSPEGAAQTAQAARQDTGTQRPGQATSRTGNKNPQQTGPGRT